VVQYAPMQDATITDNFLFETYDVRSTTISFDSESMGYDNFTSRVSINNNVERAATAEEYSFIPQTQEDNPETEKDERLRSSFVDANPNMFVTAEDGQLQVRHPLGSQEGTPELLNAEVFRYSDDSTDPMCPP